MSFKLFLKKYGFYMLVACCVVAVASVSYLAITGIVNRADPDISEETPWPTEDPQPVIGGDDSSQLPQDSAPQQPLPSQSSDLPQPSSEVSAIIEPSKPQYILPVSGQVIAVFSGDTAVKNETLGEWRTHNGTDFAAEIGTQVVAVYGGQVVRISEGGLWGNTVEILLDTGYTAVYANITPMPALAAGDRVEQGDVVGAVDGSAIIEAAQQPHLHFELLLGGKYVDFTELIAE